MSVVDLIIQISMVVAPHIGYAAQYFEIAKTNSIEGYAPLVSLILLTSNTLRLYYFLGHQYMLALLFQAIVGVGVHFVLVLKVLQVRISHVLSGHQEDVLFGSAGSPQSIFSPTKGEEDPLGKPAPAVADGAAQANPDTPSAQPGSTVIAEDAHASSSPLVAGFYRFVLVLFQMEDAIETRLLRLTPRNFAMSYLGSALVALVVVIVYYLSIGVVWHGAPAVVGYLALGVEALMVLPQILRNARRRNTAGLSIILVISWGVGDIVKVIYFAFKREALPFILCGIFQIALDAVVVAQVVYYRLYLRADNDNGEAEPAPTTSQAAAPSLL